ncbi:MAG: UDP-2,3-diacylglucosamine diphosphatase [Candidatus Krumholzibacteriia bacterium]
MTGATVVFVSDAHFGLPIDDRERDRRARFLRFLESLHGIERLVVAGDLFQFWFDLGSTLPRGYFDILDGLAQLRRSGTRVDYVAGNHDFWRGSFFRDELGIETHAAGLCLEVQGRRILVQHGDGAGPGDRGYKLLKRMLRSPVAIGIARVLHPDVLHAIARRMDRLSRAQTSRRTPDLPRLESAARDAFGRGFDALVLGHVHAQIHQRMPAGELVVIGDWLDLFSFVRLESGVLEPGRWTD